MLEIKDTEEPCRAALPRKRRENEERKRLRRGGGL